MCAYIKLCRVVVACEEEEEDRAKPPETLGGLFLLLLLFTRVKPIDATLTRGNEFETI
jgi:hypothetical protein